MGRQTAAHGAGMGEGRAGNRRAPFPLGRGVLRAAVQYGRGRNWRHYRGGQVRGRGPDALWRGGYGWERVGVDREPVEGEGRTPCASGRLLERREWVRRLLVSQQRPPALPLPLLLRGVSLRQDIVLPCLLFPVTLYSP